MILHKQEFQAYIINEQTVENNLRHKTNLQLN
jgi:hypothetical protein